MFAFASVQSCHTGRPVRRRNEKLPVFLIYVRERNRGHSRCIRSLRQSHSRVVFLTKSTTFCCALTVHGQQLRRRHKLPNGRKRGSYPRCSLWKKGLNAEHAMNLGVRGKRGKRRKLATLCGEFRLRCRRTPQVLLRDWTDWQQSMQRRGLTLLAQRKKSQLLKMA